MMKGTNKRKRSALDLILAVGIICCAVFLCIEPIKNWQTEREQERIRALAEQTQAAETEPVTTADETEETTKAYDSPIDFEELRKINPDIVAWLKIPGTKIDYPVVQTTDNETYLKKTFEGATSAEGTVYLDCDSDGSLMGHHSIIYGHHMKNKSMFTDIVKFKEKDFFDQHREIILYTPERELHLKTVAALYGDADGEKRRTKFASQEKMNEYLDVQTQKCSFRELPKGDVKQIYSFVTCSYEFENARTILYAVNEE
ncbi:MAG: class B sortase [Clostridium sp.]